MHRLIKLLKRVATQRFNRALHKKAFLGNKLPSTQNLIQANIAALDEGAQLLTILDTTHYSAEFKPAFHSTIGAHFRHVLEHYRCLFSQLETGTVCYDDRARDQLLECDAEYAAVTIAQMKEQLTSLEPESIAHEIWVQDQQSDAPVASSLDRELLFLQSHTVHHYAIIGAMTRAFGKQPEADFGVAIATRTHQAETALDGNPQEVASCAR